MVAKKTTSAKPALYGRVREILDAARVGIARTVNTTQVVANWLIGREIVEGEQRGQRRAGYGAKVLAELSNRLTRDYGRGYSVDNLEAFRQFYLDYPRLISETTPRNLGLPGISETVSRKSAAADVFAVSAASWQPGTLHPDLSWSHYRCPLRVGRQATRDFYEIEALKNAWSVRELSRQVASLLFDRLAKSRDKAGLMQLATRGQEAMRPVDVVRDPVVMEFLGLPESPRLVESKLEQALIDNLQHFLLELGKGFAFLSRQERITLGGELRQLAPTAGERAAQAGKATAPASESQAQCQAAQGGQGMTSPLRIPFLPKVRTIRNFRIVGRNGKRGLPRHGSQAIRHAVRVRFGFNTHCVLDRRRQPESGTYTSSSQVSAGSRVKKPAKNGGKEE